MKTLGTIIGRIPLTETSLIVQWCTAQNGILKTVANGARRPRSPFAGKVDLFFQCEIEVHPAKRSDLHTLRELEVVNSRFGLRKSYRQTLAASYFVKLIEKAAEPATPIPELDDLLNRALNYLDDKDVDTKAVLHFEKQMTQILGVENPATDNVTALREHFGMMPQQREELLKRLAS